MRFQASFAALTAITASVYAHDTGAKLTKPTWLSDLNGFEPGLEALPIPAYTTSQWGDGTIPERVQQLITDNGAACKTDMNYNPAEVVTFDVTYEDCSQPWTFSIHSNCISIDSMAKQFGRMPIQMRQWVRHIVAVPDEGGHAFNCAGDIVFFNPIDTMVTTFIHETGHSLDLLGAYGGSSLSDSDDWWNNYDQDANVFDGYGQSTMVEEVAQAHVVAVYNENVDGQVAGLYGNYTDVFHQYATLITHARDSGNGNSIITPGQAGECKHNLETSQSVPIVPTSGRRRARSNNKQARGINDCGLTW